MSPFATYVFEVMWDGTNWTDETTRLISVECRRGRDFASQLTGRASAGTLVAVLENASGRFASFNSAGALYGNLLPARKIRWRTTAPTAATLWQGFLDSIEPWPGDRQDTPKVTLRASGPLRWIGNKRAGTATYTSIATGTGVGHVLDDAGWPAGDRTLDTGQVSMGRWKADGDSALSHLRELEETEFGYLGESADGKVVFEDVHHRLKSPHTTSQATFSDASGAALPYESIRQEDPWREIFNRFEADVQLFTTQALATLWTLAGETPSIAPGQSKSFWARYPTPDAATQADHVDAWTTPVATTDMTANTAADGSGTDLTASIGIAVSKFANEMKVTLTNNHATLTAYVTLLQARGTAVYRNDPVRIVEEDSTSQTRYGKRTWPLPGRFYPSTARAQAFVEFGLSRYKDPLPVLVMAIDAQQSSDHLTQALTRDVSERITVVANGTGASGAQLGISRDFFIESIAHRYSLGGHQVVYELSDAFEGDAGYWTLGVSTLGESTRLVV